MEGLGGIVQIDGLLSELARTRTFVDNVEAKKCTNYFDLLH